MDPPKVNNIKYSHCEWEDENWKQEQTRKELILIAWKAYPFREKYAKNNEYVAAELHSLVIDQQHFLLVNKDWDWVMTEEAVEVEEDPKQIYN